MLEFHPLFIVDEAAHKQSVVLPFKEWEKILEIMEELDDIHAYEQAKAENDDFLSFEQAVKEINVGQLN